ncbi:MAG: hypothetical protein E7566_01555 [Ruminococcaceae bacterium]|nr:hypothetical protein [Oscillospiraceae bacterium]
MKHADRTLNTTGNLNIGKEALSNRVYLWDNIKAVLIFLVVFGHAILPLRAKSDFIGGAYIWLNTFHMPLFIFISGLFSKKAINAEKLNHAKIVSYILIFYFMKLTIFICADIAKGNVKFSFLSESGTPWYIFVTAMYIVITHLIRSLNPRKVIVAILAISLGAAYFPQIGSTLMLSRMFAFYPFFYLGYLTEGDKLLSVLHKPYIRAIAALFFAAFTVIAFMMGAAAFKILNPLYTGSSGYASLPANLRDFGPLLKIGAYLFSAVVSLSVIAILPAKRIPLVSFLGCNTLSVYALHRQLLYFYQYSALPALLLSSCSEGVVFLIVFGASAMLTVVLALKPFGYILYPFTNYKKWATPLFNWFKK